MIILYAEKQKKIMNINWYFSVFKFSKAYKYSDSTIRE